MDLLTLFHLKGGVGKTTTLVNLADAAARSGKCVLVWDLDPQAAASFYFQVKARKKAGGKHALKGLYDLAKPTQVSNIDLIPGSFSNRKLAVLLEKKGPKTLKKLLDPLADHYRYIFIDAPPTASALALHLFATSDLLVVPLIPSPLSMRTFQTLKDWLAKQKKSPKLAPFFNLVDKRKSIHRSISAQARIEDEIFCETIVPQAAIVEKMGLSQQPLSGFAPNHPLIRTYDRLFRECRSRLKGD